MMGQRNVFFSAKNEELKYCVIVLLLDTHLVISMIFFN